MAEIYTLTEVQTEKDFNANKLKEYGETQEIEPNLYHVFAFKPMANKIREIAGIKSATDVFQFEDV